MGRSGWRLVTREGDSVATVFDDEYTEQQAQALANTEAMRRLYGELKLVPITTKQDNRW